MLVITCWYNQFDVIYLPISFRVVSLTLGQYNCPSAQWSVQEGYGYDQPSTNHEKITTQCKTIRIFLGMDSISPLSQEESTAFRWLGVVYALLVPWLATRGCGIDNEVAIIYLQRLSYVILHIYISYMILNIHNIQCLLKYRMEIRTTEHPEGCEMASNAVKYVMNGLIMRLLY